MSGDLELELYRLHRAGMEKHVYFLLAAVGACIGFAATQTKDLTLSWLQLPLGAAVVFWGLSFLCGCKHLDRVGIIGRTNMALFRLRDGRDPVAGRDPRAIEIGVQTLTEVIESHNRHAAFAGIWQFRFFVLGVAGYLTWHVLEMWHRTPA